MVTQDRNRLTGLLTKGPARKRGLSTLRSGIFCQAGKKATNERGSMRERELSRRRRRGALLGVAGGHVTFDGGKAWAEYPLYSSSTYQGTGDPAVAFDASGHAYYATLGFRFVGPANATNPDILVANSGDSGKTWSVARVAAGSGNEGSVGDLLDKEYVAAWGNGNAIVTFGDFRLGQKGGFISAQIYSSVTHDGGNSRATPTPLAGARDQALLSPALGAAGRPICVSVLSAATLNAARD